MQNLFNQPAPQQPLFMADAIVLTDKNAIARQARFSDGQYLYLLDDPDYNPKEDDQQIDRFLNILYFKRPVRFMRYRLPDCKPSGNHWLTFCKPEQ